MKNPSPLTATLCLVLALLSWAAPAMAASTQEAGAFIERVGTQTVNILKSSATKPQKQAALAGIFVANVDFPWVARFVMGRYWREANDDQKQRYVFQYQRFLVRHYAVLFSDYSGGKFKILFTRDEGDDEFSVGMQVQADDNTGEPVIIEYKVRKEAGGFKIFDVLIEGVSMLTTQRSEFAAILGNNSIDYLIAMLQKKADAPAPTKKS